MQENGASPYPERVGTTRKYEAVVWPPWPEGISVWQIRRRSDGRDVESGKARTPTEARAAANGSLLDREPD